ncbi:DEAD/DEAH box helicase family protein [Enterobacter soli]|uniref:DEAD/DEAH box helicase family protein n=1 Tax=Enterobacter soli TaxID=885040 RepID=UPI002F429011
MKDETPIPTSNILSSVKPDIPGESGINRARHLGGLVLSHLNSDLMSPDKFAKDILNSPVCPAQTRVLKAAGINQRLLVLGAPSTGAGITGAMLALHRLVTRRNHRVLIISPKRSVLNHCRTQLQDARHFFMLDACNLFSIKSEDGIWSNEQAEWGLHWRPMTNIPLDALPGCVANEKTIIVHDAHQYSPEFLRAINAAAGPTRQLVFFGVDANRALSEFAQDPAFAVERVSVDQVPYSQRSWINTKREQYRDHPDAYERIFQRPITWEPR